MREAREPHATLVVNEGFDYTVAIDQLNAMESTQKCSIHVNFTVVPPKMQTGSIERFRSDVSDNATTCLFHEQAISCCPGKFLYPTAFERFRLRSHLLSCAAQNLHTECTLILYLSPVIHFQPAVGIGFGLYVIFLFIYLSI